MKTSINFILSIILVLSACSTDTDDFNDFLAKWGITDQYQNVCPSVTDAVMCPEPRTADGDRSVVITDETIRSMSTCGLLVTMLEFPIYFAPISDFYYPSVIQFNSKLRDDKVAVELFERSDCFPVFAAKYIALIKENKEHPMKNESRPGTGIYIGSAPTRYIEMLLASDLCMSVLNKKEINQIMKMALSNEEIERDKYDKNYLSQTYQLMIAIMLWCNYSPFIEEVGPRIREGSVGYYLIEPNGNMLCNCLLYSHVVLILKYAKEFLNEQKL